MYLNLEFYTRLIDNVLGDFCEKDIIVYRKPPNATSRQYFNTRLPIAEFDGAVIDGDHEAPVPLDDARDAAGALNERGVILFHDALGGPVQDGIRYLLGEGFRCKMYATPHCVGLCWRGDFAPPEHEPDPRVHSVVRRSLNGLECYL